MIAEDRATGEVLRCDVIIDAIHALGVSTTTRELYLEEAPEQFELWAQDSQGNEFSTLEGVRFDWQIVSSAVADPAVVVLQFLRFSQSAYHEIPAAVAAFESSAAVPLNDLDAASPPPRGHMTLLEGVNTGSARVAVRLPYAEYQHVAAVQVDITVLANIILDPIDAHVMVGDTVAFRILQLKQGKLHDITATSTQYYLEADDAELAHIDGTQAHARRLGRTSVTLRDRNVRNRASNEAEPQIAVPRATLTICEPVRIGVALLPHNNWVTVAGRRHDIAVALYTADNKRIHLGTKFTVEAHFDEAHFYAISRTANGSRVHGEAAEAGVSEVRATFGALQASAKLEIYAELELEPQLVILPWSGRQQQQRTSAVQFRAHGGDGQFTWSTLNGRLLTVSAGGLAESRWGDAGRLEAPPQLTHVQVALTRNPKIVQRADVVFLGPQELRIVAYNFETALGDFVDVHVAVYALHDGRSVSFTTCEALRFELDFTNDIFTSDDGGSAIDAQNATQLPALHPDACQLVRLRATALGQTQLRVVYKPDGQEQPLVDTVQLVVYEALAIFDPPANEIVLPLGASRAVIYQHGPQPLFNIETDYRKSAEYAKNVIAVSETSAAEAAASGQRFVVYTVLCRAVGETELRLQLHNVLMGAANFRARLSEFRTRVSCVKPRFLNLYTAEKLRDGCPLRLNNAALHVQRTTAETTTPVANDRVQVNFEVLDAQHRRLQNTSSLQVDWHVVFAGGEPQAPQHWRFAGEVDAIPGVPVPQNDYMITELPAADDGKAAYRIRGSVVGYDEATLRRHGIVAERPAFGVQRTAGETAVQPTIENELNFMAVNGTLWPAGDLSIFLAVTESAEGPIGERVAIRRGSGHYVVRVRDAGVVRAELNFDADATAVIVTPLKLGKVSEAVAIERQRERNPTNVLIAFRPPSSWSIAVWTRSHPSCTCPSCRSVASRSAFPIASR